MIKKISELNRKIKITDDDYVILQINDNNYKYQLTSLIEDLVTKEELDAKKFLTQHQSLDHLVTKDDNLLKADISIVPTKISQLINDSNYSTVSYVDNKIAALDFSIYATKNELGLKADRNTIPIKVSELANDLNYTTIEDIENMEFITEADIPSLNHLATITYVNAELAKKSNNHTHPYLPDSTVIPSRLSELTQDIFYLQEVPEEFVTETELRAKGYLTEGDISHLATKEDLNNLSIPDVSGFITQEDLAPYVLESELPVIPTNISEFNNDTGYIDEIRADEIIESKKYVTAIEVQNMIDETQLGGGSGGEVDLSRFARKEDLPTNLSQLTNDAGYLTDIPAEYITEQELDSKGFFTELPSNALTTENISAQGFLTTTDLDNALNEKGYLTEHQDLSAYVKIAEIENVVPKNLSTYTNDAGFQTGDEVSITIESALANYATKNELGAKADSAHSHKYDEISGLDAQINAKITEKVLDGVNLTGLATEDFVNEKFESIPETHLVNYATKEYVGEEINRAALSSQVDLSSYAKKSYVDTAVSNATDSIINTTLKDYAKTDDINQSSFINIKKFGALGNGSTSANADTAAFKSAFDSANTNGSVNIYIPEGEYVLNDYITIYSNTFVYADSKAVIKKAPNSTNKFKLFVNGVIGNDNYATGYNGNANITFIGGVYDLNYPHTANANNENLGAFDLGHSDNIYFENVTIKNGQNGHYIQVSGVNNASFINCKFLNQTKTNSTNTNYEVIQIEGISTDGSSFPTFGSFDGTISNRIIISKCIFKDVIRPIGCHSIGDEYNTDITIENCVFENVVDEGLSLRGYDKFTVTNNKFFNIDGVAVRIDGCKNGFISNNITNNVVKSGVQITDSSNLKFYGNSWLECCKTTSNTYSIIRIGSGSKLFFTNEICESEEVKHTYAIAANNVVTNIITNGCLFQAGTSGAEKYDLT